MKTGIHPEYVLSHVSCACGNSFVTRSTKPVIKLEICAACHPFYTGRTKMLDTAGRVERFQKKFASTGGRMVVRKPKTEVKAKSGAVTGHRAKSKTLSTAPKKGQSKAEKAAKSAAKPGSTDKKS
ncbi:MAG: 50S ribosomal protein L31 [bacterium]